MQRKSFQNDICPVARSLDTIGEWWSLLIVRDAMLGIRRFNDFQRSLGMARNVLSARLKKLVACGILEVVPASDGTPYQEYILTEKGNSLLPVLIALRQWGDRFLFTSSELRTTIVDKKHGQPLSQIRVENAEGEACTVEDLTLIAPTDTPPDNRKRTRH